MSEVPTAVKDDLAKTGRFAHSIDRGQGKGEALGGEVDGTTDCTALSTASCQSPATRYRSPSELTSKSFLRRSTRTKSLLSTGVALSMASTSSRGIVTISDLGAGYAAYQGAGAGVAVEPVVDILMRVCLCVGAKRTASRDARLKLL